MVDNIFLDDCNLRENLISQFQVQQESSFQSIDLVLLNHNTKKLNDELSRQRRIRSNIIEKKIFSVEAKSLFSAVVPSSLKNKYNSSPIVTIGDLVSFVLSEEDFRKDFVSSDDVIETIGNLLPELYDTFENRYPSISKRLETGPISAAETSQLISSYGLDSNSFASNLEANSSGILSLLEKLLSGLGVGLSLMGSFCSLMDNVYGLATGVRDVVGNAGSFQQDFLTIANSISPKIQEITSAIQSVGSLVNQIQDAASDMKLSMQESFQLLSSALNIIMSFYEPSTKKPGGIQIEWDLVRIRDSIDGASNSIEPSTTLFSNILGDGTMLGDVNEDGTIDSDDVAAFQAFIDGTQEDEDILEHIAHMFEYMTTNIETYKYYTAYDSSANASEADISSIVNDLSSASQLFGTPTVPSAGDFGLSKIQELSSTLEEIRNFANTIIPNLESGRSININSVLSQLSTMRSIGNQASRNIFSDLNSTLMRFRQTTEDVLTLAEQLSVTDPTRTRELQQSRRDAVGNQVSEALNLSARATSEIVPLLNRRLEGLETLLRNAAATGILETVEERVNTVVEQSASQLENVARSFSPENIRSTSNNVSQSSYIRLAGLQSRALDATSEDAVRHMQDVVRGNIANTSRGFRELNREDVEFIALRFCNLAGEIERLYSSLLNPIQDMITQSESISRPLSLAGNEVSLRAVRAGAIRLPSSSRPQFAQTASRIHATTSSPSSSSPTNIFPPQGTLPNASNGPLPPLPSEFDSLPRFSDVNGSVWRGLISYNLGGRTIGRLRASNLSENMGWDGIFYHGGVNHNGVDMLRRFISLAIDWRNSGNGSPLVVNSAYRPGDRTNSGGLSYHGLGIALDVRMNSSQQDSFATLARQKGFRGIGFYSSFIHIDTGPERSWRG